MPVWRSSDVIFSSRPNRQNAGWKSRGGGGRFPRRVWKDACDRDRLRFVDFADALAGRTCRTVAALATANREPGQDLIGAAISGVALCEGRLRPASRQSIFSGCVSFLGHPGSLFFQSRRRQSKRHPASLRAVAVGRLPAVLYRTAIPDDESAWRVVEIRP